MLRNLSLWHVLVLAAVIMLIFGVRRLPEIGAGLARGIKEFKRNIREETASPEVEDRPQTREPKRLSD